MIALTELEKGFLETMFRGVADRELIRELVRRGRFGQVQASVMIDHELRTDAKYMDYMKKRLGMAVGVVLAKETERGYVVTEHDDPNNSYTLRPRTTRVADVIFLRAPEKKEPTNANPADDRKARRSDAYFEGGSDRR